MSIAESIQAIGVELENSEAMTEDEVMDLQRTFESLRRMVLLVNESKKNRLSGNLQTAIEYEQLVRKEYDSIPKNFQW